MLKNVAMSDAQSGALARTAGSALVVFAIREMTKGGVGIGIAVFAEGIRFLDGAGDHVPAARPFAQVDQPAPLGTEREVGLVAQNDLATGGTTQAADFLRHRL